MQYGLSNRSCPTLTPLLLLPQLMQYGAHKRNVFVACQISNDILHNNIDNYLYFIYLKRSITLKSKHKNGFTETRN